MDNVAPALPHQLPDGFLPAGMPSTYQYATVFWAIAVAAILCLLAFLATRRMKLVPGRGQSVMELLVTAFRNLMYSSMGPEDGRRFLPLVGTIFLFVFFSNIIAIIPAGEIVHELTGHADLRFNVGSHTFILPGLQEPTKNVNVPWALGIMVFVIMHGTALLRKGPARYFSEYLTPFFGKFTWPLQKPAWRVLGAVTLAGLWGLLATVAMMAAGASGLTFWIWVGGTAAASLIWCLFRLSHQPRRVGIPNLLMMPLNVIGKFAEILSMSFRLFGNIFGGAVIIALLGGMVNQVALPIMLQAFMGIFVGAVQAFVFSMLSMTYIAVELAEEEEEEEGHHGEPSNQAEGVEVAAA